MLPSENPLIYRVTLGFLRAGRVLDGTSSVLLLATLGRGLLPLEMGAAVGLVGALLLAALAKYYAWRVALDADFFALLHEQPEATADFDAALANFRGRTTPPSSTPESRWRGARQLVQRQALVVAAQLLAIAALLIGGT
ncbi:hypothetical protein [Hymenobacter psychrophilus]|uniref:Uncharacterized protein n=1 Tax=Hymenobacter psychrophilus TaxID=651662 RepID=A0A1H3JG29_9BACT|nr:hypothetical protein [Hymenobacter psychrophilus]SDY38871.1 hypothetical protein SAMN04488069_10864 [Hymenobacter psychrophilus]